MTLLRLFLTISSQKINEDNLNERDYYGVSFSHQPYRHGSYFIFLFKYRSFDQSDPPEYITSNLRHLLSCGTIVMFSLTEGGNQTLVGPIPFCGELPDTRVEDKFRSANQMNGISTALLHWSLKSSNRPVVIYNYN